MSLRDTLEGARKEAQANLVGTPKKALETAKTEEEAAGSKKGFSKRSAASARPSRNAAESVRLETKPKSQSVLSRKSETKEEKKARKKQERLLRDRRDEAYTYILESMEGYKKDGRIYWIILIAGASLAVLSLVFSYIFGTSGELSLWQSQLGIVTLVAAYACIIGSFVYDLVKRRKYRKEAESRVSHMTDRKVLDFITEQRRINAEAKEAKEREKAARKAARKKK